MRLEDPRRRRIALQGASAPWRSDLRGSLPRHHFELWDRRARFGLFPSRFGVNYTFIHKGPERPTTERIVETARA